MASVPAEAAGGVGNETVTTELNVDGVDVILNKSLRDYGSGIYELTLTAKASLKTALQSTSRSYAENGYFVAPVTGTYLVELYGGRGGDGGIVINEGGLGGAAGHVWGKVKMNAGDTLIFTVGSNGGTSEIELQGGGANGSGGDHGTSGVSYVGGGGGYSAVYYFDHTVERSTVTAQERLSNYIMIAAGGGGGGAGSDTQAKRPNGGRGGFIGSASGVLTANDNPVPGRFFAGSNGESSADTSTRYVGRGGGSVPGQAVTTLLGEYQSEPGNDWPDLANSDLGPGAGGNGELRGGGGGAGFCGGSGGIMAGLILAVDVGGGGGGSSFVADTVDYQSITDAQRKYLQSNTSPTGGACYITYLADDGVADTSDYRNMTVKGYISRYFDIVSISGQYQSGATYTGTASYTTSTSYKTFTATGVNIEPHDVTGLADETFQLTLMLRAKEGFAGGNGVPTLYETTSTSMDRVMLQASGLPTQYWEKSDATDFCNVPLDFSVLTHSFTSSNTSKSYPVADLYTDEYASVRSSLSSYWQYDYISSMTAYKVTKSGSSSALSGSVSPTETTAYTVSYTVTPKTAKIAKVGAQVGTTTFSADAVIAIVPANTTSFQNVTVAGSKVLKYDGTYYQYGLNVRQTTKVIEIPEGAAATTSGGTGSYSVTKDGWYFIQAWGGNGGNSGSVTTTGKNGNDSKKTDGGKGGKGGYISGYAYLKEGQVITYSLGTTGSSTSNVSGKSTDYWNYKGGFASSAGYGGTATFVRLDGTELMVASGGGGAGATRVYLRQIWGPVYRNTAVGGTPAQSTTYSTTYNGENAYNGGRGTGGAPSSTSVSTASGGSSPTNYRNEIMGASAFTATDVNGDPVEMTIPQTVKTSGAKLSTAKSGTAGKFVITCLEVAESSVEKEKLDDISCEGIVSRYFTVESVSLDLGTGTFAKTVTDNGDGTFTATYKSGSTVKAQYTYRLEAVTDSQGYSATKFTVWNVTVEPTAEYGTNSMTYITDMNFTVELTPVDGFLGGNDVPVTEGGLLGAAADGDENPDAGVKLSSTAEDKFLYLPETETADYANVDVAYVFEDGDLEVYDKTILKGESFSSYDLFSGSISLSYGWKSAFVKGTMPQNTVLSPTKTTDYDFTLTVQATAAPTKATVVPSAKPASITKTATVFVEYAVTQNLSHATWEDAPARILYGEDLVVTLAPEKGYVMPTTATVKIGSSTYSYSVASDGTFTVPASRITDHVTVTATAAVQTFSITYFYPDDGQVGGVGSYTDPTKYEVGAPIDLTWYNAKTAELSAAAPVGHEFRWIWQIEPVDGVYYMPGQDWEVTGNYTPILYDLTVHYYKAGSTEQVAPDHTEQIAFGSSYTVLSPNVSGYLAEETVLTGTMSGDLELTVYYTATEKTLTVIYLTRDTNEEFDRYQEVFTEIGTPYSIPSPAKIGYTAEALTVTGEIDADGEVIYVFYDPNTYGVTFDPDGGILADGEEEGHVAFNNVFGFDPTLDAYVSLPTPVKSGYDFLGWFDGEGNQVTEATKVTLASDVTLTAKWQSYVFKLTIDYVLGYSPYTVLDTDVHEIAYGTAYSIPTPDNVLAETVGRSPDVAPVSGVMGNGNKHLTVTFHKDVHTLTVNMLNEDGDVLGTHSADYEWNDPYSFTLPAYAGYTKPDGGATTQISGTMGTEDVVIDLVYEYVYYTVTVTFSASHPISGVTLPEVPDTVVLEGLHIGDTFQVTVPDTVVGYAPSTNEVTGTVASSNLSYNVNYTPRSYTLTVNYLYADDVENEELRGTAAAAAYQSTLYFGQSYSVASPTVVDYDVSDATVAGVMGAENTVINVTYVDHVPLVSVTVEWGASPFEFDYENAVYSTETHIYFIPPAVADTNFIRVTNNQDSEVAVQALITYLSEVGDGPMLYFTQENDQAGTQHSSMVLNLAAPTDGVATTATCYVWMQGYLPVGYDALLDVNGNLKTGKCTVLLGEATL